MAKPGSPGGTAVDEILGVAALLEQHAGNQTAVAAAIGKSRTYVNQCCRSAKVLRELGDLPAGLDVSRSLLFEIATAHDPGPVLDELRRGRIPSVRAARQLLAQAAGNHPGRRAHLSFQEDPTTGALTLRLYCTPSLALPSERLALADRLEQVAQDLLKRLRSNLEAPPP